MASHGSQNDQTGGHLQQRVEAVEIDDFIDEDDWLMDIQIFITFINIYLNDMDTNFKHMWMNHHVIDILYSSS